MQKGHTIELRRVPRRPVLVEGVQKIAEIWKQADDVRVTDRSRLVWNSDLIETLEFDNLISQAAVTVIGAGEESRGAHAARTIATTTSTG